ncbi:MAG: ankyrin repeat domain-containing protein [Myxococcaceae bacterium]|nr:ankyrin repeat domain-containing protein [Myxococcaceae bacterium]
MSLFDAVKAGDAARVEALLDAGEDPNPIGEGGRTALMAAAEGGNLRLVRALLAAGAEPILTDDVGETALVIAAAHGHPEVCQLLMPHAREDEADLARQLLKGSGNLMEIPPGPPEEQPAPSETRRKLASAGAYVSSKLGDDGPMKRLGRLLRSEKGRK